MYLSTGWAVLNPTKITHSLKTLLGFVTKLVMIKSSEHLCAKYLWLSQLGFFLISLVIIQCRFNMSQFFGEVGMTWKPIQGLNGHFSYAGPSNNFSAVFITYPWILEAFYHNLLLKATTSSQNWGFLQETESHSGYNLWCVYKNRVLSQIVFQQLKWRCQEGM